MVITGKTFTWTSSDTSVATISTSGLATGKTAGVTAITAEVDDTSNAVRLTVTKPPPPPPPPPVVHRVTVTPETPSIAVGKTQQFTATAYDSNNVVITGKTFTWTSSDTSAATIDSSGLATAVNAGTTTITAETGGIPGTASLTVTETPPPGTVIASVVVSPASASIQKGETQQFTAKATDSAGTEITGKTFTWESSATTVATIDSLGLATAVNTGSTTIKARTDGVSGTASLTVTEPPICPMLKGSIANQTLTLGGSAAPIDLMQYFSLPEDFVPTYVVSSTDTSVTTTSLAGAMLTVTPAAAGTDTVSVTVSKQDCDAVKQSFVVTVILPCPAVIADAPIQDQTLVVGAGTTQFDLTQHFEHIDQDGIEISVTSPSPGIATAVIEGTSLKIDPVAAGQIAAIAVTVTDTAESDPCDPVSQSFMVTVEAALEHPGLYPWSVSGEHVYRLNGNVGIGVEVPDQKLVVDGTVKAEGYRLRMIPADYVFEEGYDLLSLDEVESYIRNHGHLPGVASGVDMKANGLGISRMQTTLLEKIEELSLYIIAQHEQLREQGDRLASQQQKLEIQKTQVSELEQRLRRWER
ncbi:MAG: Ig domain-containing protein [Gemmatimonadetes bacterium]|nr:Ig domain-containing protein [Gemmatimonadota bacterium]